MSIRIALISGVIAAAMGATAFGPTPSIAQSIAQAKTTAPQGSNPPAAPSMGDKAKTTAEDVSKWTQKQWNAAKAKWVKEKVKWNSCNKQATDQKLSGRNSWSFIYTCMTS